MSACVRCIWGNAPVADTQAAQRPTQTAAGEALYGIAERIFEQEEEALALLQNTGELRAGRLRVGAVGPYHVMEMLAAFHARHPAIDLAVSLGNSEQISSTGRPTSRSSPNTRTMPGCISCRSARIVWCFSCRRGIASHAGAASASPSSRASR